MFLKRERSEDFIYRYVEFEHNHNEFKIQQVCKAQYSEVSPIIIKYSTYKKKTRGQSLRQSYSTQESRGHKAVALSPHGPNSFHINEPSQQCKKIYVE